MNDQVPADLHFTLDPDIDRAFKWLIGFLPDGEWTRRKAAVEEHIEALHSPSADSANLRRASELPATNAETQH